MPRLKEKYKKEIVPKLMEEFKYKNANQVPQLEKIILNMGIKEGVQDIKVIDQCANDLTAITGQRAVVTRAKKAISNFKIRKNSPIGARVTLRRNQMYEFLDRLVSVAMPRIKDFQGVRTKSFDRQGNFSMGLTEQLIFPEIVFDKIKKVQGMDITFVISGERKEESKRLLELLGMPFRRN